MKDTIQIDCLGDLKEVGIRYLTGEACCYSLRFLAEIMDEDTKEGICAFFGLPRDTKFDQQGGMTMMLPRENTYPLAAFLLLRKGYPLVYEMGGKLMAMSEEDTKDERYMGYFEQHKEAGRITKVYGHTVQGQPHDGNGNAISAAWGNHA